MSEAHINLAVIKQGRINLIHSNKAILLGPSLSNLK